MKHPTLFDRRGRPALDWAAATQELARTDPALAALNAQVGPFAMVPRPLTDVYAALGHAVLRQQVSGAAADSIQNKLNRLFDARHFPDARAVARSTPEALRAAGLSGAKARSIIELAQKAAQGDVPTAAALHALDDDAIVEALTVHRGIGRWTVEMLLMFRMGRPDVLPVDDYGVKKGFQRTVGMKKLPHVTTLRRRAERWRPYRTIASWYLWRALEL